MRVECAVIIGVFGPGHLSGKVYSNYNFLGDKLDGYANLKRIVTGGGVGVEQLALRYATENGIEPEVIPPNIKVHGKEFAFVFRNQEIIEVIDIGVLLWNGTDQLYYKLMQDFVERKTPLHVYGCE